MAELDQDRDRVTLADARLCPRCAKGPMLPGPMGGNSQNFFCKPCNLGWNLHFMRVVVAVECIGKPDPETVKLYTKMHEALS